MTVALVDGRMSEGAVAALGERGFRVVRLPPCKRLPEATSSHPDMLFMRLGDSLFCERGYFEEHPALFDELTSLLPKIRVRCVGQTLGTEYPCDCILNALLMGSRLFIKRDSDASELLAEAERFGIRTVSVKQGYPACTVLALGDSHAITADQGMARSLRREGVEVLLIENGEIELPPYEYGFIGGAAGVFDGSVYFIGDPMTHRQGAEICAFIEAAGYSTVSLKSGTLSDLGRIVFIDSDEQS